MSLSTKFVLGVASLAAEAFAMTPGQSKVFEEVYQRISSFARNLPENLIDGNNMIKGFESYFRGEFLEGINGEWGKFENTVESPHLLADLLVQAIEDCKSVPVYDKSKYWFEDDEDHKNRSPCRHLLRAHWNTIGKIVGPTERVIDVYTVANERKDAPDMLSDAASFVMKKINDVASIFQKKKNAKGKTIKTTEVQKLSDNLYLKTQALSITSVKEFQKIKEQTAKDPDIKKLFKYWDPRFILKRFQMQRNPLLPDDDKIKEGSPFPDDIAEKYLISCRQRYSDTLVARGKAKWGGLTKAVKKKLNRKGSSDDFDFGICEQMMAEHKKNAAIIEKNDKIHSKQDKFDKSIESLSTDHSLHNHH